MPDTDLLVMEAAQDELLDPAVVTFAFHEAFRRLTAAPEGLADRISALRTREATLTGEVDRLTAAIASGGELAALVAALKQRDHDCQRLEAERRQLEAVATMGTVDAGVVERELVERVNDWRAMAARNVAQGRQLLRKLLRGRVRVTPKDDGTCELSGQADYGKLFSGIPVATALASPRGTESSYQPVFKGIWRSDRRAA